MNRDPNLSKELSAIEIPKVVDHAKWEEWLATRPACVQKLARSIPCGSIITAHGECLHVVGYAETDDPDKATLLVSPINPFVDYAGAVNDRHPICSCCLEQLIDRF